MRYIPLKVSEADLKNIAIRKDGDKSSQGNLFGQLELLIALIQSSPKCTKMTDLAQFVRILKKTEDITNSVDPILEFAEDEWVWVKEMLTHDKYQSYGANSVKNIGTLLETIINAKTEK